MKPINRSQFQLAEQVRNRFTVTVEAGTDPEDVVKEETTQHIAAHLRIGDILEVCPEDQAWYLELKVKEAGKNFAKFNVIHFAQWVHPEPKEQAEQAPAGGGAAVPSTGTNPDASKDAEGAYTVTWGGPSQKFRVIRKADNEVMQSGFADKEAGQAWIVEHEKTAA